MQGLRKNISALFGFNQSGQTSIKAAQSKHACLVDGSKLSRFIDPETHRLARRPLAYGGASVRKVFNERHRIHNWTKAFSACSVALSLAVLLPSTIASRSTLRYNPTNLITL